MAGAAEMADPVPALATVTVAAAAERVRRELAGVLAGEGLAAGSVALSALGALASDPPDVLVLAADVRRPAGMAALRRARRALPATHLVVVAAEPGPGGAVARESLNAGAEAFVPEPRAAEALGAVVAAVCAGFVCAPRTERRLLARPTFSHREKEVLGLVVQGLTNKEIAARLFLSESTVKTHLVTAFGKLGVRSRKDAAALLLDPEEGLGATSLAAVAQPVTRLS